MKNLVKRFLIFFWHHAQAYSLVTLPINGLGALSSFLGLFTLVTKIIFPLWAYAVIYLLSIVVLFSIGVYLKKSGFLQFYNSMTNKQSPELIEILEILRNKK